MYEANPAYSRQSAQPAISIFFGLTQQALSSCPSDQDVILRKTCRAAEDAHGAMMALSLSVASLRPDDPRHEAATAAIALLQPSWRQDVEQVAPISASGSSGLQCKARLLHSLAGSDGAFSGSPAQRIAASLAADMLRWAPGF